MPANSSESPEGGQQFEWSETFHTWVFRGRIYLRRYWWIFLLTVSASVGLQAYKEYNRPPVYQSFAEMSVPIRVVSSDLGATVAENLQNFFQTQNHILASPQNLERASQKVAALYPEFAQNPPPWPIVIPAQDGNTSFIELSATGSNAYYTQYFLQAVMDSFLETKSQQRQQIIEETNNNMLQGVEGYNQKIKDLQSKEGEFLKVNNIIEVNAVAEHQGTKAAALREDLAVRNSRLNALQQANLTAYINGEGVGELDRQFVDTGLVPVDPNYGPLKTELKRLEAELSGFDNVLRPQHPKVIGLSQKINDIQTKLKVLRRQTTLAIQDRIGELKNEIKLNDDEYTQAEEEARKYSELKSIYEGYSNQIEMDKVMRDKLLLNVSSLDYQKDINGQILSINQKATPAMPQAVNAIREIGTGAFAGFIAGAALIFLLGVLDGRVMSVEDFSQRFDDPVLGIIPMQKRVGGQVELLKNNDQRLMFAESCRNLRSSLLYQDKQGQRPRSIVLTSSIPSEGKSTISANLSITLGFAASRTLLVDADLRRGQLHKRFGVSNDFGLAEHIQDNVPLEKVIQRTNFENLDFISCGKYPAQPGELLMSDRFQETVRMLKERYDFVVFDAPPVLATDDAASFATRNDAVIFVVRAGYTRLRQIRASLENLHRRNVHIYGVVVNFIDHREPGYYSYKYYDYYSYRTPSRSA